MFGRAPAGAALLLVLALPLPPAAAGPTEELFLGDWVVDVDASLAFAAQHPSFADLPAEEREKELAFFRRLLTTLDARQRIEPGALSITARGKTHTQPFQVQAAGERSLRIALESPGGAMEVELVLQEDGLLRIDAEEDFDMQYYLWRRAEGADATAAASGGAEGGGESALVAEAMGLALSRSPAGAAAADDLPQRVDDLQDALKAHFEGAWAVTSIELYSDCDGSFTSNEVRGRLVKGEGLARFQPGELAKVQKVDVRRSRIDVDLALEEPLLVPRQDGPFTLYQELRCQAALEVDVERETVREDRFARAHAALREVLEAYPTIAEARDSNRWNGRQRQPYPEDYETTLAEYRAWKRQEQDRLVRNRIGQALDRAAVYLDFMVRDPSLGRAFATGAASVRGRLPSDCSQLLGLSEEDLGRSNRFGGVALEFYVAGQRLAFHLEMARKLRGCLADDPA